MSFLRQLFCIAPVFISVVALGSPTNPDYYRDVYPFLKTNCISCHNKTTTKAGLNMETPELMKSGGDSGPSIIPGNSAESLVVEASQHIDMEMPPKNNKTDAQNLTPTEIVILKTWIDQGAKSSVQRERKVAWQPLAPGVHPIYTVAMTGDGRYAACGRSNDIAIYDLETRQLVTQIPDAHRALVQSMAFSPDGTRLASGGFREVKIWKKHAKDFYRKADPNSGIIVSQIVAGGTQIVCGTKQGELQILEARTGKVIRKIPGVAITPIKLLSALDDKAAVFSEDGKLTVWDLKDGTLITTFVTEAKVNTITWTGDRKGVVSGGDDKLIRIYALADGSMVELKGSAGAITVLSTEGDQLISTGTDNKIRIWSIASAKPIREIPSAGITALELSPDGKQFVTGGKDGAIRTWNIATGKQLKEFRGSVVTSKQIADLEWKVAAQVLEQAFQRTEASRIEAQNKALDVLLKKAKDTIVAMNKSLPAKEKAVKPVEDARTAAEEAVEKAAAAYETGKDNAKLEKALVTAKDKLITAKTKETSAIAAFKAVQSNISDAEAQVMQITGSKEENTKSLAAAKAAGEKAKEIQLKTNTGLGAAKNAVKKPGAIPLAVSFSQDKNKVAAHFDDGKINVWAVATGAPVEQQDIGKAQTASLKGKADGTFAVTTGSGAVRFTESTPEWTQERIIGGESDPAQFRDRVNAVRFSPDGKTLATGGGELSRSGDIHIFDISTGKSTATWLDKHDDTVVSLDFSPDGKLVASGSADKIARVTDIATGKQTHLFEGHTHHVLGVSFRADGRVLATAGADGTVNSWDMIIGERKKKIIGWNKEVTSLQFIGATDQIVTSAGDNLIRIVSDAGRQIRSIAKLPDFMQAAASSPGGTTIIGGGEDSFLRVWDGTNGKEIVAFGTSDN